ncbi:YigZ family protein [Sedimentibacter saalensis]|uniref:Putative YigZ family protein n=1 Tax=Sedimentibacter saalensis TaxID=130788 RepID=A0A562JI59_9FIRM|nr:YigZ family protein [Sedimentibacter saalensis]TWH82743.1 putative YigZ family protein [Sedimentibacter saalensis]
MSDYKSIHKAGRDEIIINKSKFIGSASPIENEQEAIEFIEKIRKEFKDATHNVYAYVIGENSNIQRYSDDKEPSGTAGMPVLNVIMQENLRNVVVVVTRYFGGVLLGAGGLVRAYTKGAKIGLEKGIIVEKNLYYQVSFSIEYPLLGKMDNELMKNEFIVKDKIYLDQVEFHLVVKEGETEKIKAVVKEITSGQAEITVGQADYYSVRDGKIVE